MHKQYFNTCYIFSVKDILLFFYHLIFFLVCMFLLKDKTLFLSLFNDALYKILLTVISASDMLSLKKR